MINQLHKWKTNKSPLTTDEQRLYECKYCNVFMLKTYINHSFLVRIRYRKKNGDIFRRRYIPCDREVSLKNLLQ